MLWNHLLLYGILTVHGETLFILSWAMYSYRSKTLLSNRMTKLKSRHVNTNFISKLFYYLIYNNMIENKNKIIESLKIIWILHLFLFEITNVEVERLTTDDSYDQKIEILETISIIEVPLNVNKNFNMKIRLSLVLAELST